MSIPKRGPALSDSTPKARSGQYFDAQPAVESRPITVRLTLDEIALELKADRGVFGSRRVDLGTLTLLREAPKPPGSGELLDLGCGYGPITLAIALRSPAARVWAVDVNERALELTRANAATARTANVTAVRPDEVPADVRFAAIYSNPPVRIGKGPLHELLLKWLPRLEPGGAAHLVVQRNLGSDSLADWLQTQGYLARKVKSKKGYRILEVRAGPAER